MYEYEVLRGDLFFMKYKAIAAGLLAANLLAHPISSLAETKKFPDVSDSAWSKDAIYYLVERNVINGMPDGNFMPYGNLTRAQAAKIIATAIGAKADPNAKPSYNDAKIVGQLHLLQPWKKRILLRDENQEYLILKEK